MSKKSKIRQTRKHRRLDKARLKTGKRIIKHKLIGGRTGQKRIKERSSGLR